MGEHSKVYLAFDTAKLKHPVAVAEGGRGGEIRFVGEIENRPATIQRLIKLGRRYRKLQVCFEAGPTGYGLYRQMQCPAAQISRMIGAKARARRLADTMCDNAPGALPLRRENVLSTVCKHLVAEGISIVDSPVAPVEFGAATAASVVGDPPSTA